ncbi:MAG: class III extradiol ring-cleavage dioxygenase [Gammaproteobacteria bacterium]
MAQATILYIPHGGGPLPLLSDTGYETMNPFLREFPATIEKPDVIIVISAHWEDSPVAILAQENPSLLYDYYGFPAETYELQYPAPGAPALASRIHEILGESAIEARLDRDRGFDHGVFVPLLLMYPDADIPCIQVSLSQSLDAAFHIRLGQALSALKNDNLLILGSGFSFHNLPVMMRKSDDAVDEKNRQFEQWLAETCSDPELNSQQREQRLVNWEQAPHARYCHPREEHLLPLHVCYGIGGGPATTVFQDRVAGFITSAYRW